MSAEPLADCPECDASGLRRVIGLGAGIIFKGSGFYQTDYRKESKPANSGSDASEKPEKKETATPAKSESGTTASTSSKT